MAKKQNKQLNFTYDQEGDVLNMAFGKAKEAISQEIEDDFFVRFDPQTQEVLGFMILNFQHRFQHHHQTATIPIKGYFELNQEKRALAY